MPIYEKISYLSLCVIWGLYSQIPVTQNNLIKTHFFTGEIVTRVDHINNGNACTRQGTYEFRATGKRKYWRLQQMENPCDPVTDYVDIYF